MANTLDFDASIEKIMQKFDQIDEGLQGIENAYDDVETAEKRALGGATKSQDEFNRAIQKTEKEIKEETGLIQKLDGHLRRLEKGQKKATDPKLIKKYNAEIAKTNLALKQVKTGGVSGLGAVNGAATASGAVFKTLGTTIQSAFLPLLAVSAVVGGIKAIVSSVNEYEQIGADLQAITGANDATLEILKQSAVEVGLETTISAAATLEAYKLIASAKPELLSNAAALAEITREAVTLTESFGGDLPTVAANLTDIMNKLGLPAREAARAVNAIAAGSKEGSADVSALAASFLVAGTEMKAAKIPLEEGVGILEAMAETGNKGSEAGTKLRNVISKLSATEILPKEAIKRLEDAGVNMDTLSDQSLTFAERLEALKPIQDDANALTAVFGLENKSAAQELINSTDRIKELTAAVTDTSVATDQAATRTATAKGEFLKLGNTIQALIQGNGGGISEFVALLIRLVREGVLFLGDAIEALRPTFSEFGDAIGSVVDAFSDLFPAQEDGAEGFKLWELAIGFAIRPLRLFISFLTGLANGIAWVVDGFNDFLSRSPKITDFFQRAGVTARQFIQVFIDIPAYTSGALAAVGTFTSGVVQSFKDMGSRSLDIVKELFNFKKLITGDTSGLTNALSAQLVNPFKGIGEESAKAFEDAFNEAKKPVDELVSGTGSTSADAAATAKARAEADALAKAAADKAAADAETAARAAAAKQKEITQLKLAAMADGLDKELALEEFKYKDLTAKFNKFGLDTTDIQRQHELNKFDIKQKFLKSAADLEGLTGEERINFLYNQTVKELDAVEQALRDAGGGEIVETQQKQLNLLRKQAADSHLEQINKLNGEERKQAQQHEINLLELERDNFDNQKDFEEFKGEEILNIRLRYAEAQLAVLENLEGADSDAALALRRTINGIKGDLAKLEEVGAAKDFNLFSLFGLDPNDPNNAALISGIETAASSASDIFGQVNALREQSADAAINKSKEEISALQSEIDAKTSALDTELDLAEQHYANNSESLERDIALLRQRQESEEVELNKALEQKKKIQKQQAVIDTITQSSSLITAAAQIFQSVAGIPFLGPVLGASLVAGMLGSFAAAKVKVFQGINAQKAEKGLAGTLSGDRHTASSGGIQFGNGVIAEDGEVFGILSRVASSEYGEAHQAFTNAANSGDRASMIDIASSLGGATMTKHETVNKLAKAEAKILNFRARIQANERLREQRKTNAILEAIRDKRPDRTTQYGPNGELIETDGMNVRIIK